MGKEQGIANRHAMRDWDAVTIGEGGQGEKKKKCLCFLLLFSCLVGGIIDEKVFRLVER